MKTIIFVGHGSRDPEGNREIQDFAEAFSEHTAHKDVEVCFLEFAAPDIPTKLDDCVLNGSREIYVIPLILLPAGHTKLHIPGFLDDARKKHPDVKFVYGVPIGDDPQIPIILQDRFRETMDDLFDDFLELEQTLDRDKVAVLVVGRGSSDPDANSTLYKISRLLWEKIPNAIVETAFMGITSPRLEEGLDRCRKLGAENIIVVPYFLFTGVLLERMIENARNYEENHPGISARVADYMGFHPLLINIVARRLEETLDEKATLNCDLCQYRVDYAKAHHAHIHHDHGHGTGPDHHKHNHNHSQPSDKSGHHSH